MAQERSGIVVGLNKGHVGFPIRAIFDFERVSVVEWMLNGWILLGNRGKFDITSPKCKTGKERKIGKIKRHGKFLRDSG